MKTSFAEEAGIQKTNGEANARLARKQTFALEQVVKGVQSDLQKEVDGRNAQTTKLNASIVGEHRFSEAAVAAEA